MCEEPPRCMCDVDPVSGFSFFQSVIGNPGNCLCNPVDCYNSSFPRVSAFLTYIYPDTISSRPSVTAVTFPPIHVGNVTLRNL